MMILYIIFDVDISVPHNTFKKIFDQYGDSEIKQINKKDKVYDIFIDVTNLKTNNYIQNTVQYEYKIWKCTHLIKNNSQKNSIYLSDSEDDSDFESDESTQTNQEDGYILCDNI